MKYTMYRLAIAILLGAVVGNSANAGFGSHGGLFGGGSSGASAGNGSSGGAGYGSSGAGYGSSGGASYSGYGSSGGSYVASYGSSGGGSSGASTGGSSGRPGLLSRLHTRVHSHIAAKHARRAAYGSSGGASGGSSGGYVGYGSSGGSLSGGSSGGYYSGYSSVGGGSSGSVSYGSTGSVSYGSTGASYGSTGSSYGSSGSAIHAGGYGSAGSIVPEPYYGTSTTSTAPASALVSSSRSDDAVKLNVSVPESAKVYVNDRLTTSTGEVRQFVSRGLETGKSYRFEVRAEMNDNGKVVTDTQSVVVTAGSQENVRFVMKNAPKADSKIDTAVVLNVPENAEVTLAGNQTQVKGTTRVFKTSQLKAGDVWDDYVIQVKVGEQVKTQTIRLIAGDKLELSFDFDNNASRLAAK